MSPGNIVLKCARLNTLWNIGARGLPEKTPNSQDDPKTDQDLEALAEEVLSQPSDATNFPDVVDAVDVSDSESSYQQDEDVIVAATMLPPEHSFLDAPPRAYAVASEPIDPKQMALQRRGGAVGGVLLGALTIAGALLTNYSLINGCLGLALSFWGLSSGLNRTAIVGVVLSILGMSLTIALGFTR
jgi:hypothetical protein